MADTTTTRRSTSRTAKAEAARAAQGKPQLKAVPNPSETPKPKPQVAATVKQKPTAEIALGARQVTVWFPQATLQDGALVRCAHQKYGHETEAAAKRCISALVAQRGHRVS